MFMFFFLDEIGITLTEIYLLHLTLVSLSWEDIQQYLIHGYRKAVGVKFTFIISKDLVFVRVL